ncbi:MAG: hypothetical protein CBC48_12620 [bacterium TMED88]|nr:hypothetical protein [Deltaproteobacteria bacterium]OUV28786.1 MAG: hypothetical protein CBC48_12620 [bacterium TMED88]
MRGLAREGEKSRSPGGKLAGPSGSQEWLPSGFWAPARFLSVNPWDAVDTAPALRQISAVVQFLFRRPELTESPGRVAELRVCARAGMASPAGAIRCIGFFSSWSTCEKRLAC